MNDTESVLPPRVDWRGNERPASPMEVSLAEGSAIRIRGEVAEIRSAAERLTVGTAFEIAVAEFLTVQARMLENAGSTARRADILRPEQDTRDAPGMFPSAARSALLIARAYSNQQE